MTPEEQAIVDALAADLAPLGLELFYVMLPKRDSGTIGWKWRSEAGKLYGDIHGFDPTLPVERIVAIGRGVCEQAALTQQMVREGVDHYDPD